MPEEQVSEEEVVEEGGAEEGLDEELEGLEEEELEELRAENLRLRQEMDELRFTEPENEEEIEVERKKLMDELAKVRQERDKLHLEQIRQQVLRAFPEAPPELVVGDSKGALVSAAKKATAKVKVLKERIRAEERAKLEKELGKPVPIAPEVSLAEETLAEQQEEKEYKEALARGRSLEDMAALAAKKTEMLMKKRK